MRLITNEIKLLLKLTNVNCFLPYYDEKTEVFKIRPFYFTAVFIIYVIAYIYMFYIKATLEGKLFPERGMLLMITSGMLAFVGGSWLISNTTKQRIITIQTYFDTFEEIDRSLSAIFKLKIKPMKRINLITSMTLMVNFMCILIGYQLWALDTESVHYKLHFIADVLMVIGYLLIVLIIIFTLEGVKRRYDVLAKIIADLNLDGEKVDVIGYRIDCLTKIHNAISDLVINFNQIFSWMLFGVIIYTILVDLMTLGFFITGYYKQDVKIFICIVEWTLLISLQVIAITTMCERVIDAGKNTVVITYKTISRLCGCVPLRAKLVILGSQMEARCPKFNAAGFFDIDFTMLFTFTNLMVTYIIVIIQFANNS